MHCTVLYCTVLHCVLCTVLYCTVLVDLSLHMLATCVLGAWHCLCWLEQCPGWGLSTLATSVQGRRSC